jgi:ABC-type polar amino acid transport system ATPase subunit
MIEIAGLHKKHGAHAVLKGIELSVRAGEVAVLIGSSGSGKTTLLRCINGLEGFDQGTLRVGELVMRGGSPPSASELAALRRAAGMVFQGFHLFPHLTALDNLTLAPRIVLAEPRERAEERGRALLERVGLAGKERSFPHALSGGQQQRVAIARALLMKPLVLLLDEPTSALDPRNAADVLAILQELAKDGQTMVVATHAMAFARSAATTVHVMAEGARVEQGTPAQVFDEPKHEATRRILQAE